MLSAWCQEGAVMRQRNAAMDIAVSLPLKVSRAEELQSVRAPEAESADNTL